MIPILVTNVILGLGLCYAIFWALRNRRKKRLKKRIFEVILGLIFIFFAVNTAFLINYIINKSPTTHFYSPHRFKNAPVYNITNFHVVTPGILRGGQPTKEGLIILKGYFDLKTIVNLRGKGEMADIEQENKFAKELGLDFVSFPMDAETEQSVEKIQDVLDIITDKARQPVYVHCHGGKDRTGLVFAAYRLKYDHWGLEDAYKEWLAYGYNENFYNLNKSLRKWYDHLQGEK
jgi:protein tyrosine phosphatase (PTP) superfamily phosphohydrolase (DUF442 family)